ncbi:hypothetical protein C2R22_05910 [Salinigranum rubrum]|uniref:Uncharacterized protein n=1 Tax=Salinigranum rubrum TaxID=755307 RepID=A0A2I8VH42_9EURY|nr:hypothetical protein [Salinigranum rubrum]AUV81253.1 hypothetical protein C2R22_05910 [Salinigranum rubrum]
MSAANNSQLSDALSGAFVEIALVTDLGQAGESESIIGFTKGETTVSNESTDMEVNFHESEWTQRNRQHKAITIEFMTQFVKDMPQLETIGIVDSDGVPQTDTEQDLRFYIYPEAPNKAQSADQVVELYRTEIDWGEGTLAGDNSELPFTGYCNGGYKFGKTTA